MNYSSPIKARFIAPGAKLLLRAWRALKQRVNAHRPRLWVSYVIARDLRLPMDGHDCTPNVRIETITHSGQAGFRDLVQLSRRVRIRRELCEQYLKNGAVGCVAYVLENGRRQPAGMGWVTQALTDVPFLNAHFRGGERACMLYQDFVMPAYRGMGLQRMLGKHRCVLAAGNGVHWCYGYIRRANSFSLRNAVGFAPLAIVHNLRIGVWQMAHVRSMGRKLCGDLPFENWPAQRSFYIKPVRDPRPARPAKSPAVGGTIATASPS